MNVEENHVDLSLRDRVAQMLDAAWRKPGFCVPNPTVYPHQWLWDSCFHSIIWAELGDERAVVELANVLSNQDPASGFVPHMVYWSSPEVAASFWGRNLTSCITQPPMFGHAAAELVRRGFDVPASLCTQVGLGLWHLLSERQRTDAGLVPVFHPWETGCDDSPRWDAWRDAGRDKGRTWRQSKGDFVASVEFGSGLAPYRNVDFTVGSVGFNALVVFNAREYLSIVEADLVPRRDEMLVLVDELEAAVCDRWVAPLGTWEDDPITTSGGCRTADAVLCLLVDPREEGFDQLGDLSAFGSEFGPSGVHQQEPSFDPGTYWRGSAWPQLNYLLAVAAYRAGHVGLGQQLCTRLRRGALLSTMAEYWNPHSGQGLGASPQTWAGLAIVDPG